MSDIQIVSGETDARSYCESLKRVTSFPEFIEPICMTNVHKHRIWVEFWTTSISGNCMTTCVDFRHFRKGSKIEDIVSWFLYCLGYVPRGDRKD